MPAVEPVEKVNNSSFSSKISVLNFMALACGQKPDHSTIATFVSSIDNEIDLFFTKVLLVCEEEELLGGTHFSLDGLKLSSNAAKEWSGTFSDLKKKQEALSRKVKEAISEHREADKREDGKSDADRQRFEKRIKRLKQKAENIEEFLAENEPKIGSSGKELQSNVTDNESAKMATSHGVMQGYNANVDRFTLRGKIKVNIQWMLYCIVHNIEKIINYGKSYAMAPI